MAGIVQPKAEKEGSAVEIDLADDEDIGRVARTARVIAVVGLSPNEVRPSWGVARYLQAQGFRVVPVNPNYAGTNILGEHVFGRLADIPHSLNVDMIDIFRRSEAVPGIVDEALMHLPQLKVIWTQIGVRNDAAAQKAEAQGLTVIQDRCPKIEFPRHL
jgi:predicted CoA-binding protein